MQKYIQVFLKRFVNRRTGFFVGLTVFVALASANVTAQNQKTSPRSAGLPDLQAGLLETPGCLGVESAITTSGKNVIFAWFKDKQSVLNWYYSDMHRGVQKQFFPDQKFRKPLEKIPDDIGPIMAIASITFASEAQFKETHLPISQIAIELYQPVSGGLFLGGRFAPEELKVKSMNDYTPRPEKKQ